MLTICHVQREVKSSQPNKTIERERLTSRRVQREAEVRTAKESQPGSGTHILLSAREQQVKKEASK